MVIRKDDTLKSVLLNQPCLPLEPVIFDLLLVERRHRRKFLHVTLDVSVLPQSLLGYLVRTPVHSLQKLRGLESLHRIGPNRINDER